MADKVEVDETEDLGSAARNQALSKRKRKAPIILDDDEYLERMAGIIRRDFYPDLHELYQENGENPVVDDMPLQKFQQKFTSEDNESFKELHAQDHEKHKKRFYWAYENIITDQRLIKNGSLRRKALMDLRKKKKQALGKLKDVNYNATRFAGTLNDISDSSSIFSGVTEQTEPMMPSVNGYTFVTTPSSVMRPSSVSSEFSVAKKSRREEAAQRLSRVLEKSKAKPVKKTKLTERERQRQNRIASVSSLASGTGKRKRMLTPAARSLAERLAKHK